MNLEGKVVTFTPEDLELAGEDILIPLVWDFNDLSTLANLDWIIPEECMSENHAVLETATQILLISSTVPDHAKHADRVINVYLIDKDG